MAKFKEILRNLPLAERILAGMAAFVTIGVIIIVAISSTYASAHSSGIVVSKHVVAAHQETKRVCTLVSVMCVLHSNKIETAYVLDFAQGETQSNATVSKVVYNKTQLGSHFQK